MNKRVVHYISLAITPCICTALFIVPVNADTDIYFPDPNSYEAYDYFFNNGYQHLMLSSSKGITFDVDLSSTGNAQQDNYDKGSIDGNVSGQEHTTGTINSNNSTLGSKYMTCTTNNKVSGTQTYSCYFSSMSSGVSNSQTINLQMNENTYTSVNNSIDTDLDIGKINTTSSIDGSITSTTNSETKAYLPWLHGTYEHYTSYTWDHSMWLSSNARYNDMYFVFYTPRRIRNSDFTGVGIYPQNSDFEYTYQFYDLISTMYLNVLHIQSTDGSSRVTIDFENLADDNVMPVYYGSRATMPDDVAVLLGLQLPIGQILNNGNSETSSNVSDAATANNTVSDKINSFDQLENHQVNQMEYRINNIDVQSDLMSNNKFLSSARWVKAQFDRMTVSTPIGSVLSFSLILGLALIFLGKIR